MAVIEVKFDGTQQNIDNYVEFCKKNKSADSLTDTQAVNMAKRGYKSIQLSDASSNKITSLSYDSDTGKLISSSTASVEGATSLLDSSTITVQPNLAKSASSLSSDSVGIIGANTNTNLLDFNPNVSTKEIMSANTANVLANGSDITKSAATIEDGVLAKPEDKIKDDGTGVNKDELATANSEEKSKDKQSTDKDANGNEKAPQNEKIDHKTEDQGKEDPAASAQDVSSKAYVDPRTDVFHLDVQVFLEGVEVPYSQCSISYGIGDPPTCTLVIPANNFLRELPATTKVHVVHKDLLPDDNGEYKKRLLFDGELSAYNYSIDPSGASITIHAIHCCAYLTFMQLMCQEVREYLTDPTWQQLGDSVCQLKSSFSSLQVCLIGAIIKYKGNYLKSMADLVYIMLNYLIDESKAYSRAGAKVSSTSRWYHSKLGNVEGGYKILQRIYGVDENAKNAGDLGDYTREWRGNKDGSGVTITANGELGTANYNITINADSKKIYDMLIAAGLNSAAACGVLGNIQGESSFRLACKGDIQNGVYTSFGLCQWHGSRGTKMKNAAPNWETNLEGQINYLLTELESSYKDVWDTLRNVPDTAVGAKAASDYFVANFEIPADIPGQQGVRGGYTLGFWNKYGGGKIDTSSGLIVTPIEAGIEDTNLDNTSKSLVKKVNELNTWVNQKYSKSMLITGGARSAARNASVNGATNSKHLTGDALDVSIIDFTPSQREDIKAQAIAMGFNQDGEDMYHDKGTGYHMHLNIGRSK